MSSKSGWFSAGLAATALTVAGLSAGTGSAQAAVVYCKTEGVPQGCVVRPTVVPVAGTATAVRVNTVRVTRIRVANVRYASVGVGARGVGVRPGTPFNRGGPVNRIGRR